MGLALRLAKTVVELFHEQRADFPPTRADKRLQSRATWGVNNINRVFINLLCQIRRDIVQQSILPPSVKVNTDNTIVR